MTSEKQAFQTGFLITLFDLPAIPLILIEPAMWPHYERGAEQARQAIAIEECTRSRWFMRGIMDWREQNSRRAAA